MNRAPPDVPEGRLLILPCGHSIGMPDEAPVFGLFAPIRDHEASCERATDREEPGVDLPFTSEAPGPAPAPSEGEGYLSPHPSRFVP